MDSGAAGGWMEVKGRRVGTTYRFTGKSERGVGPGGEAGEEFTSLTDLSIEHLQPQSQFKIFYHLLPQAPRYSSGQNHIVQYLLQMINIDTATLLGISKNKNCCPKKKKKKNAVRLA